MPNLRENLAIAKLSEHLYGFLPASGNSNTSFPLAAEKVGLEGYWTHNSKLPAIKDFLTLLYESKSHKIVPFIEEVVNQSVVWRGSAPDRSLKREEIEKLSSLLGKLGYKSPQLADLDFLSEFPSEFGAVRDRSGVVSGDETLVETNQAEELKRELLEASALDPNKRGFAFERFLTQLFDAYGMSPGKPFRLIGEQIDGSFDCNNFTYLLEAKWAGGRIGQKDLLAFKGKVDGKATWSRGLFIGMSGFSEEGIEAFCRGKPTNIICMDGFDLHQVLDLGLSLPELIRKKSRKAAETNKAYVSVRELL